MRVVDFTSLSWTSEGIGTVSAAAATSVAFGRGKLISGCSSLEPGGEVAPHETGFGQLFVPIAGEGWVSQDADRVAVRVGQAAYLPRGVIHAKGTDAGLMALVIQVKDSTSAERFSAGATRSPSAAPSAMLAHTALELRRGTRSRRAAMRPCRPPRVPP